MSVAQLESLPAPALLDDPVAAAKAARLRHVSDDRPGITRHQARHGFDYRVHGELISDVDTLSRIKSLAIPPAWTDVWICPWPNGHIQGNRTRCPRSQAVPLSPALARRLATRRNTIACWSSATLCRGFARGSRPICSAMASRASASWRQSCALWS